MTAILDGPDAAPMFGLSNAVSPAALGALLLLAGTARADGDQPAFSIGSRPAWFGLIGATSGGTLVGDAHGVYVGGELSLVRVRDAHFAGLYADAYYDFGAAATYLTGGPELGLIRRSRALPIGFGLDGGLAVRFGDDTQLGAAARAYVDLGGSLALYGRYLRLFGDESENIVQLGATLKFPL